MHQTFSGIKDNLQVVMFRGKPYMKNETSTKACETKLPLTKTSLEKLIYLQRLK